MVGRLRRTLRMLKRSLENKRDLAKAAFMKRGKTELGTKFSGIRMLVIETRHLGDVLFATPTFKSLKLAFPSSHLTAMIRPGIEAVLKNNPWIDDVIFYEDEKYIQMVAELSVREFDRVYLLDRDERLAQLAFQAGIPMRIGYDRPATRRFLTLGIPRTERGKPEIYWSLRLARATGGNPVDERIELFAGRDPAITCFKWELEPNGYILLHPGSNSSALYKRWPVERYSEVARRLVDNGQTVVVSGVDSEKQLADFFVKHPKCHLLFGQTSLEDLIDLVATCRLLITNDTGPSHIAAALDRPCIAVTGFADPRIYHPYPSPHMALYHSIRCSPCFGSQFDPIDCPYHSCLKTVTVDEVLSNADLLIRERVIA